MTSARQRFDADVDAQVRDMVNRLAPAPRTPLAVIIGNAEKVYGKPISLQAVAGDQLGKLTGLLRETPEEGIISYRLEDPVSYQLHCVCHEIGHAVFKHEDCTALHEFRGSLHDGDDVRTLVIRGRGAVSDPDEIVAEEFAYRLIRRLLRYEPEPEDGIFG